MRPRSPPAATALTSRGGRHLFEPFGCILGPWKILDFGDLRRRARFCAHQRAHESAEDQPLYGLTGAQRRQCKRKNKVLIVFAAHVERNGNRQVVACQRLGKNPGSKRSYRVLRRSSCVTSLLSREQLVDCIDELIRWLPPDHSRIAGRPGGVHACKKDRPHQPLHHLGSLWLPTPQVTPERDRQQGLQWVAVVIHFVDQFSGGECCIITQPIAFVVSDEIRAVNSCDEVN